ncbi:MAG: signal peptidase II [Stackebrandtia sp.]
MTGPARAGRVRLTAAVLIPVLAGLDLGVKAWAESGLADGRTVDLALIQLRLAHNSGVAFSFGDTLPAAVVLAATGLIIAALAAYTWRAARTTPAPVAAGLALVVAGAVANFTDRAADGVVTDYLHTGWFPTFNGADVLITVGVASLILGSFRAEQPDKGDSHDRIR